MSKRSLSKFLRFLTLVIGGSCTTANVNHTELGTDTEGVENELSLGLLLQTTDSYSIIKGRFNHCNSNIIIGSLESTHLIFIEVQLSSLFYR